MVSKLKSLTNRAVKIAALESELASRDERIAALQGAVAERDGRISVLEGMVSSNHEAAAAISSELKSAQANLKAYKHQADLLKAVYDSTSWRLTKPLRQVLGALKPAHRNTLRRAAKLLYWLLTPHRLPSRLRLIRARNQEMRERPSAYEGQNIETSPDTEQFLPGAKALDNLSDGEFILSIGELLFHGGGASPRDIEHCKKVLQEDPARRTELIRSQIEAHVARQQDGEVPWDPYRCWIMGTDRFLTPSVWQERALSLTLGTSGTPLPKTTESSQVFKHSGRYLVSAIASLYKGRRYLKSFLDNITSQTIFDQSELIIIDANSPEGEQEIIAEYQKTYPNIIYRRINYRIGVYEAWNVGIQLARGKYLTNTNLDDLRRRDSFKLQSAALDLHEFADVAYQDFYYSFNSSLSFSEVAQFGFKSDLPIITANNLLAFNSPHNAPMWRKSLHDEIGLFDTSYKSAGDWDFWLSCLWKGKSFIKINTPHVAYFQNPEGLSTGSSTRGVEEARQVVRRYARKLISPHLLMSRRSFANALEITPDWNRNLSYYDVVQNQLKLLGNRH